MRVIASKSRARIWLWLDQRQARGAAATRASKSCTLTRKGEAVPGRADGRVGWCVTDEGNDGKAGGGERTEEGPDVVPDARRERQLLPWSRKSLLQGNKGAIRRLAIMELRQRLSRRQSAELEARAGSGGWRRLCSGWAALAWAAGAFWERVA